MMSVMSRIAPALFPLAGITGCLTGTNYKRPARMPAEMAV